MDKNIILIGLGLGAIYLGSKYKSAYDLAKKLSFSFKEFSYDSQNRESLTLSFYIEVDNPTKEDITIRNSALSCYLNSSYAGRCFIPYTQVLKAGKKTKIIIATQIYYKEIFSEWWALFLSASTSVHLTIAGSIRFNGVMVPIPAMNVYEFNLKNAITQLATN